MVQKYVTIPLLKHGFLDFSGGVQYFMGEAGIPAYKWFKTN